MGNCGSNSGKGNSSEAEMVSRSIDLQLRNEWNEKRREVSLLLFGSPTSHKNILLKQLRLIYLSSFSTVEKADTRNAIRRFILDQMLKLIVSLDQFGLQLQTETNRMIAQEFKSQNFINTNLSFSRETADKVKLLWSDPSIQQAYGRTASMKSSESEYESFHSSAYFFKRIDNFVGESDNISASDYLRVPMSSSGVVEVKFQISDLKFRIIDPGSVRGERNKWLHKFSDVTMLLFCAALDDFLAYDEWNHNQMHETIKRFQDLISNIWFQNTGVILLFTKTDEFKELMNTQEAVDQFRKWFPDYSGTSVDEALSYIKEKFLRGNQSLRRPVYSHFTCETDTENIKVIFNAIKGHLNQLLFDQVMPGV